MSNLGSVFSFNSARAIYETALTNLIYCFVLFRGSFA